MLPISRITHQHKKILTIIHHNGNSSRSSTDQGAKVFDSTFYLATGRPPALELVLKTYNSSIPYGTTGAILTSISIYSFELMIAVKNPHGAV